MEEEPLGLLPEEVVLGVLLEKVKLGFLSERGSVGSYSERGSIGVLSEGQRLHRKQVKQDVQISMNYKFFQVLLTYSVNVSL